MKNLLKKIFKSNDPIESYNEGCFQCLNCKAKLPYNPDHSLFVSSCSSCDFPVLTPEKIGDFLLFQPLGAGGMGSVYKAISFTSKRHYAVKIIPRDRLGDRICEQNIMSEGQIGEILESHPNIVSTVDYGIKDNEYFLATEFCDGERLDNLIEIEGTLPEKRALEIILALTEALIHIVDKGYLYRDMKPENVMIDIKGNIMLFDFGLCMLIDIAEEPDDDDADFAGSPLFVPPERITGDPEGEFSEVYTLGLLLFYIMTGKTYYTHDELLELVKKHVTALRVSSTRFRLKHCGDETIALLDKMIQREPEKRYQTMRELHQDIQVAIQSLD